MPLISKGKVYVDGIDVTGEEFSEKEDTREYCKVIAFKHQFTEAFKSIRFVMEGWKIIDWEDRHLYKAKYYFQINVKKPWNIPDPVYDYILSTGRPYMVCELSCFRENSYQGNPDNWYYTLGWYHFLRQGYFHNSDKQGERWERIQQQQNITMLPWRSAKIKRKDDYALICLQKATDSTLLPLYETYGKVRFWLETVCSQVRSAYPSLPIVIRPHLRTKESNYESLLTFNPETQELNPNGVKKCTLSKTWNDRTFFEGGAGLQKDLDGARIVLAYNSNVLTQSILQGIPSFCYDRNAMAAPMCLTPDRLSHKGVKLRRVEKFNREQWLHNLSYTQWTIAEIADGTAWKHLNQYGWSKSNDFKNEDDDF
jgi:hypothetical protein